MEKVLRTFDSFDQMKDEEYRYWQSVPAAERIAAAWELSIEAYTQKGVVPNGQGLRRTSIRLTRP